MLPERFERAGRPFESWMLGTAVEKLTGLAASRHRDVLLRGDFHHDNFLSAKRGPWLAIDPLPVVPYSLFRKGDVSDPAVEWPSVIRRLGTMHDRDPEPP